jgi:hypothetical protein
VGSAHRPLHAKGSYVRNGLDSLGGFGGDNSGGGGDVQWRNQQQLSGSSTQYSTVQHSTYKHKQQHSKQAADDQVDGRIEGRDEREEAGRLVGMGLRLVNWRDISGLPLGDLCLVSRLVRPVRRSCVPSCLFPRA